MTTITREVGRGDFLLHRFSDERIGVLWEETFENGMQPKNIIDWTATLTLESDSGATLLEVDCTCTSDGYAIGDITQEQMSSGRLSAYTFGRWRIVATNGAETELLGCGNFQIV